jgi:anti-anti-sigma factor
LRGGFEQQARCQLFRFIGQLDAYSDKQFLEFIESHRHGGHPHPHRLPLVLDLTHIDFMDSSGLGALVVLAKNCKDQKQQFLVAGNARVMQIVKLVRLEEFLNFQPDLDAALGKLPA